MWRGDVRLSMSVSHGKAPPLHGAHVKRSFGVGAMSGLSAALIVVQYPDKELQFLTEGSR
jgi:hypothetical protein